MQSLLFVLIGMVAGLLGSMVGLGGGVFVVPVLTLFFGIPIHQAIAASVVGIIATSTTGAISYVRGQITNMRLGMAMETLTAVGAIFGGLTSALLNREVLSAIFCAVLLLMACYIIYKQRQKGPRAAHVEEFGLFGGQYYDPSLKQEVGYRVRRLPIGLAASLLAGNVSGMLGIGGGPIIVPAMTVGMGVPMKAAAATSNFMIGVTGCASAYIYYMRGTIDPLLAVPIALGVMVGAFFGSHLAPKVHHAQLSTALAVILLILSVQMGLAALGVRTR
jgi:uncharacterized protein